MLTLLIAAAAATLSTPAPAQDEWKVKWERDRAASRALGKLAGTCGLDFDTGLTRGINYAHEVDRYLRAMFKDPQACPGLAQKAARFVIESVGSPERADIDLVMLHRAWTLVREGRFVRRDATAEERYARMLWLFADRPRWQRADGDGWDGADRPEWRAWSEGGEAIALLTARNAMQRDRTARSLSLEADLRLRRDLPWYAPARAAMLLERPPLRHQPGIAERLAALLTDGAHLPPDHARAARAFLFQAAIEGRSGAAARRALLDLGRKAEAHDRSVPGRALALNLYFGAALDGDPEAVAARDALLARIGRVPTARLAGSDAERIGRALDRHYAWELTHCGVEQAGRGPLIRLRALIVPSGRVTMVKVAQGCGMAERDQAALGVWLEYGAAIDLSASARGRWVWVDLPPVDPALDTYQAYIRWKAR